MDSRKACIAAVASLGWLVLAPGLIIAQEHAAEPEGAGSAIFSLDPGLVIWTWVLFLITLAILSWKVFPMIAGGLEERQRKIQEAIDEAHRSRAEAEKYLAEQRQVLDEAGRKAKEYMERGREAAENTRKEILAEAREQQLALIEEAKREIQVERDQLVEDVRREAIDVSIAAAERLMRANMNSDENRRLVTDYVSELR